MQPLTISVSERAGWIDVTLVGELEVRTAPQLRQTLQEVQYGRGARVVLDLNGLEFLDSFGMGVIVGGLKRARSNDGALVVAVRGGRIRRLFEVTGLDAVLRVVAEPSEA